MNGIEKCEDLCKCGANLRLHEFTFNANTSSSQTKFYIDCENRCGRVSDWYDSPEKAIEEFDKEFS